MNDLTWLFGIGLIVGPVIGYLAAKHDNWTISKIF